MRVLRIVTSIVVIAACSPTLAQSQVAIVQNFASPEIDMIQILLADMGHMSQVFDQENLTFDDVSGFDLVMWDDLSFQGGGLSDNDVGIFESAFSEGIPLYLIGDDLAYSYLNLSENVIPIWTALLHLNNGGNFGGNGTLTIVNSIHPVTNGPFGLITDFSLGIDPDETNATGTGEVVLGISGIHDVLLVFEEPETSVRSVTQNCMLTMGSAKDQPLRDNLFKNAVAWLLDSGVSCPWDLDSSGAVSTSDLLELFAQWNTAGTADFDGDGTVGTSDLLILFANWGPC